LEAANSSTSNTDLDALREAVRVVLDQIRPTIQDDGGDLELVEVTDTGVARIRLHGACVNCPSSAMTLHQDVERSLRAHVPGVTGVERVA